EPANSTLSHITHQFLADSPNRSLHRPCRGKGPPTDLKIRIAEIAPRLSLLARFETRFREQVVERARRRKGEGASAGRLFAQNLTNSLQHLRKLAPLWSSPAGDHHSAAG